MPKYRVMVADNFHFMDADDYYEQGLYNAPEEAVAACQKLVDRSLEEAYKPGMTPDALYDHYTSFGDDPFICVVGEPAEPVKFSAWDHARERCNKICITE